MTLADFFFCTGVSRGEQLEQHSSFPSIREGDSSVINCTYTDSASSYFYWYKQEPRAGPQFLTHILSNKDNKQEERLTVLLNKKDKHLPCTCQLPTTELSHSLLCSRSTVLPRFLHLHPNLQLGMNTLFKKKFENRIFCMILLIYEHFKIP